MIGGVAAAFAERYELNLWAIRFVILTAVLSSNVGILLYLLFWIAIPSERFILGSLRLSTPKTGSLPNVPSEYFQLFCSKALARINTIKEHASYRKLGVALSLLFVGVILLFPKWNDSGVYYNPLLFAGADLLNHVGGALFFFSVAVLFLLPWAEARPDVFLAQPDQPKISLDKSERKVLFGLLSGIASHIGLDAAYLRAVTILANLLTLGGVGIIYLITAWFLDRQKKDGKQYEGREIAKTYSESLPKPVRMGLGLLFLLLAITNIANEYRLYFFNKPFVEGLICVVLGIALTALALKFSVRGARHRLWLLIGPAVLFYGIYEFSMAAFSVQLSFIARFQLAYMIAGTSFIYYSIVGLSEKRRVTGVAIGVLFYLMVFLIQFGIVPSHLLILLVQFYDFFFPVLFSACGVWLSMER